MRSKLYFDLQKSIYDLRHIFRYMKKLVFPNAFKIEINDTKHLLLMGDSSEELKKIPPESIDLIITDPPYNIGLKYDGKFKDNLDDEVYYEWCKGWLRECARILKRDGNLFLINYPEKNAYLVPFLDKELKLVFKRWLTWHYPTNVGHSKNNFTRSQRSILFYSKSKDNKFFIGNILQPYKNPTDKRVKELIKNGRRGRKPYDALKIQDLFEIQKGDIDFLQFNIVKNVSKDKHGMTEHPCVIPKELIKVLINAGSKKGDTILDPFSGTFSVSVASAELGRNSIGIDSSEKYVKLGLSRLNESTIKYM